MPDAKNNARPTGDIRTQQPGDAQAPPQGDGAQVTPPDSSLGRDLENEGKAGKGINQAGYLKDKDAGAGKG